MAKIGYYGGNPAAIMNAPADQVAAILDYEAFESAWEEEYIELNKSTGS